MGEQNTDTPSIQDTVHWFVNSKLVWEVVKWKQLHHNQIERRKNGHQTYHKWKTSQLDNRKRQAHTQWKLTPNLLHQRIIPRFGTWCGFLILFKLPQDNLSNKKGNDKQRVSVGWPEKLQSTFSTRSTANTKITLNAPEQKSETLDARPSLARTDPTRPAYIGFS